MTPTTMIEPAEAKAEITEHLWRYLSRAASLTPQQPRLADIPLLLRGDVRAIRRRSAVAVLQAFALEDAVAGFEEVLRRLPTSIGFKRVELEGRIAGRVDWVASRSRGAVDPGTFVCDLPVRSSQLPLNRTLRAIVEGYLGCVLILRAAVTRSADGAAYAAVVGDGRALGDAESNLRALLTHPKIAGLRPVRVIEQRFVDRLCALGLDERLADDAVIDALDPTPSPRGLVELISHHLLAPADVPTLFELLVAVRLTRALEQSGLQPLPWRILAPGQPFASFRDEGGGTWKVFWQRSHWLVDDIAWSAESRYLRTMDGAGVNAAALRPDLVVVDPTGQPCLVEVKYTNNSGQPRERSGVVEMMAYLHDIDPMPAAWTGALGVVVAHGSAGRKGAEPIIVCDESLPALQEVAQQLIEQSTARSVLTV